MNLSNQKIKQNETTNTLSEILDSINLETCSNTNDTNDTNNIIELESIQNQELIKSTNVSQQVQLLTNDIDRNIGNYLLNELEKKQAYIDKLEEAITFQEKEIDKLKIKLEAFNKLELISKIKSNMDTKLEEVKTNLSNTKEQEYEYEQEPKTVQIKKFQNQTQSKNEEQQYPKHNKDLVLRVDSGTKVKLISKEEEEPRYNGIMMLDKPKNEPVIKIQLDYDTETLDNSSTTNNIVKQRRRKINL